MSTVPVPNSESLDRTNYGTIPVVFDDRFSSVSFSSGGEGRLNPRSSGEIFTTSRDHFAFDEDDSIE